MRETLILTMQWAGLVFCILLSILMIYDAWCVFVKGEGSSVSNFLINAGFKSPAMVGGFFFLAGHLFGYMTPNPLPPDRGFWPTLGVFVFCTAMGYYFGSHRGVNTNGKRPS